MHGNTEEAEPKVYSFKELIAAEEEGEVSSRALDKARCTLQQFATDDGFWFESVVDLWTEALCQIGFFNVKIWFSGFWSQGDGACFEASIDKDDLFSFFTTMVEPNEVIDSLDSDPKKEDFRPWILHKIGSKVYNAKYKRLALLSASFCIGVNCDERSKTTRIDLEFDGWNDRHKRLCSLVNDFEEDLNTLLTDLTSAIYKSLEQEYDYVTSDEALIEDSDCNEYKFDEDGDQVR